MSLNRNTNGVFILVGAIASILIAICPMRAEGHPAESSEEAFQRLAGKFQFFGVNEFLYGRREIYLADPLAMQAYLQTLDEFTARNDSVADILPLLKHSNPKVRLLAIMALYDKCADHELADIQKLSGDQESTYPDPPFDNQLVGASGIGPPHEPKTVGEAANAVLKIYYRAAGYGGDSFDNYWKPRKARAYCAGWFVVRLMRATRGQSPFPQDSVARIHTLRKQVDELPLKDRRWIILRLALFEHGEFGTSNIASESELAQVSREIGSDTLRKMIRDIPQPSDAPHDAALPADPDLSIYNLSWFIYATPTIYWGKRMPMTSMQPEISRSLLNCVQPWRRPGFELN